MEQIKKDHSRRSRNGNFSRLILPILLSILSLLVSSFTEIDDIFQVGIWTVAFLSLLLYRSNTSYYHAFPEQK